MTNRGPSFEAELSTQADLSEHLANRALDAHLAGDNDAFRYASEIHDETRTRIERLETARSIIRRAFDEYRKVNEELSFLPRGLRRRAHEVHGEGGLVEKPIGAVALDGMVLAGEL